MRFRKKVEEKTPDARGQPALDDRACRLEGRLQEARLAKENLEALRQEAGAYLLEAGFLELLAALVDEAGHHEREIGMKLNREEAAR